MCGSGPLASVLFVIAFLPLFFFACAIFAAATSGESFDVCAAGCAAGACVVVCGAVVVVCAGGGAASFFGGSAGAASSGAAVSAAAGAVTGDLRNGLRWG